MKGHIVALLGIWHLYHLAKVLSSETTLVWGVSAGLLLIVFYTRVQFYYRRFPAEIKMDALFFGVQAALALLYFFMDQGAGYAIVALLFIGIELIRLSAGKKGHQHIREQELMKEERNRFNETFRIVRSQRHDFLKHVTALQFMMEREEMKAAQEYMSELVDGFVETNLSIKGEKGVAAGILHQTYRRAKASGMEVFYQLDVPLSSMPLKDTDLVALIGNVLDNAREAAEAWQNEKEGTARISLESYKRGGVYILICTNSCLPIPNEILDGLYKKQGMSTKEGMHEGLGTKVIANLIKKHQGFLDFTYKNEKFILKLKVPAIVE